MREKNKLISYICSVAVVYLFFIFPNDMPAATKTSIVSGSWNVTATWGGAIPAGDDEVIITSTHTVTLGANTPSLHGLIIQPGAVLNNGAYTLSIGACDWGGGGPPCYYTNNGIHNCSSGLFRFYEGTGFCPAFLSNVDGSGVINGNVKAMDPVYFLTTCSISINGNLNAEAPSGFISNAGVINIAGDININFNASPALNNEATGIINQTGDVYMTDGGIWNYGSFIVSGFCRYVWGGEIINAGSMEIAGDVTMDPNTPYLNSGALFMQSSGSISKFGGSVFPPGFDMFSNPVDHTGLCTAGSGLYYPAEPNSVEYNGAADQSIETPGDVYGVNIPNTYSGLTLSTSGIKSLEDHVAVHGNLTIKDAAQLDITASTYSINIYGNWTNTSAHSDPFVEKTGTVLMNGINSQTVSIVNATNAETFYNLMLNKDTSSFPASPPGYTYYNTFLGMMRDSAVHLQGDITVNNQLDLYKGGLYLNTHTLTIANPATNGMVRTYGFIKSETIPAEGYSFADWKIANSSGIYEYPFGRSFNATNYIPVTFNITNAGDASGSIAVATYSTAAANTPYPTGVTNVDRNGADNSANTVDRFWIINSSYTLAPTADFILTAATQELGSIANPRAQRWNTATNLWEFPLPGQTYSITATGVSVSVPGFSMISSPWTISDNNALLSAKPVVTHSPDVTLCYATATLLTANGSNAVYYSWSPGSSLSTTALGVVVNPTLTSTYYYSGTFAGHTAVLASPTVTTTYTLITSNNSGIDTSYITVLVPTTVLSVSVSSTICEGIPQVLSAGGSNSYSWMPSGSLSSFTGDIVTASPDVTTTYTIIATDNTGCIDTATTTLSVIPMPELTVSAPLTICYGKETIISATVVQGLLTWNNGSTANSIAVRTDSSAIYTVFAANSICTEELVVPVTVIPLPVVSAGSDQFICVGAAAGATLNGSGSSGSYAWSPGAYLSSTNNLSATGNPPAIGNYDYTLTVTESHGCSSSDVMVLTVGNSLQVNAGADFSICSETTTAITATATAAATLLWFPANNLSSNSTAATNYTAPATAGSTQYILTATAQGCNPVSDTLNITVWALPSIITSSDMTICQGKSANLSVTGAIQYGWSPSQGLNATTGEQVTSTLYAGTTYTVTGTDGNGCSRASQVTVFVNVPGQVIASDDMITNCGSAELMATGGMNYTWSPAAGLSCSDCANPAADPQVSTIYTVKSSNDFGCSTYDSVKVTVFCLELFVPNAFSPNNDSNNDQLQLFIPKGEIASMTFTIYDRWGNEVFTTDNINKSWDGAYLNQPLRDDVFVYYWDVTDVFNQHRLIKGNVTLIK